MIYQSMKMAWKSVMSNKMRSFLTMLGIIIGVFALDVLVSLVSGATDQITDSINALGTNMLVVRVMDSKNAPLHSQDLETIAALPSVAEVAPVVQGQASASTRVGSATASITGTTRTLADIQQLSVESGRFLMTPDEDNHLPTAVISRDMALELFGRTDVVGEQFKMGDRHFSVIGVLEQSQQSSMPMMGKDYSVYIPYSTLLRMGSVVTMSSGGSVSEITTFYARAASDELADQAEVEITDWLYNRFSRDEDAYFVFNQSVIADTMSTVTGTLSLLLGGIAAISLLVGGIGIMNIMLVSVTERTREIGIRKAIGASRSSIMLQFLIEALMVSLMGCILGIGLSWVAIRIIDHIGNVSYGLSPGVVLFSVIFSMGIGVLFGLYPANKAARKKPIDALRYTG